VAALNDEIARREQALVQAGEADREALTRWQLEDGKGDRPQPTVPAIKQEIAARKADRDAAIAASERVFGDKARYVEKNRRRLVREADKATADARARYERALEDAEQARANLVAAREASLWASFFPGELMTQQPDMAAIATNLRKPVEAALQVTTRLAADGVFAVLRSDAGILATAMTREQALALGAADPHRDAAIWQGTPEHQEQMRKERQEARERYRREWGRSPDW